MVFGFFGKKHEQPPQAAGQSMPAQQYEQQPGQGPAYGAGAMATAGEAQSAGLFAEQGTPTVDMSANLANQTATTGPEMPAMGAAADTQTAPGAINYEHPSAVPLGGNELNTSSTIGQKLDQKPLPVIVPIKIKDSSEVAPAPAPMVETPTAPVAEVQTPSAPAVEAASSHLPKAEVTAPLYEDPIVPAPAARQSFSPSPSVELTPNPMNGQAPPPAAPPEGLKTTPAENHDLPFAA